MKKILKRNLLERADQRLEGPRIEVLKEGATWEMKKNWRMSQVCKEQEGREFRRNMQPPGEFLGVVLGLLHGILKIHCKVSPDFDVDDKQKTCIQFVFEL